MLKRRRYKLEEQEQLIPLINEIRKDHPRMSARDIYLKLQPMLYGTEISLSGSAWTQVTGLSN